MKSVPFLRSVSGVQGTDIRYLCLPHAFWLINYNMCGWNDLGNYEINSPRKACMNSIDRDDSDERTSSMMINVIIIFIGLSCLTQLFWCPTRTQGKYFWYCIFIIDKLFRNVDGLCLTDEAIKEWKDVWFKAIGRRRNNESLRSNESEVSDIV